VPRRTLFLITAAVLALHWLVLGGVSLGWHAAPQPAGQVFSTRSIAPAPLAPPAVQTAEPTPPARARPAASARPAPRNPPATTRPGPGTPVAAPPATVAEGASDATQPRADAGETTSAADAVAAPAPPPPAGAAEAAAALPASADAPTGAGLDISPPGDGAARSASTAPPPTRLPPPARLSFDVTGQAKTFAYNARAELLWQHDGNRYEARQEIGAFLVGSRAQRSVGTINAQGLLPERFSDRSRSEQAAHFDYSKGRVIFSANTPDAALGPGAQDRLSVFIQLGALLAADPGRFVPGTQITLTTVSARTADRWTFSVDATETLDLPAGPTEALKLQRLPRKDYDQKAELWVAPALGYLPVRIRITQANGDFADLQLSSRTTP